MKSYHGNKSYVSGYHGSNNYASGYHGNKSYLNGCHENKRYVNAEWLPLYMAFALHLVLTRLHRLDMTTLRYRKSATVASRCQGPFPVRRAVTRGGGCG